MPFVWTEECQEAFDSLKELVTTAPALLSIDYSCEQPIILSVGSSYLDVGMILFQMDEHGKHRPSQYGSLPFSLVEATYSQPKLELCIWTISSVAKLSLVCDWSQKPHSRSRCQVHQGNAM